MDDSIVFLAYSCGHFDRRLMSLMLAAWPGIE